MDKFRIIIFSFLFILSLKIHAISAANDTIDASESIRDEETLVSSRDIFELGFFSPGNSTNRYLGIWYKNIPGQTVVWVANRESPLKNNSGVLIITASGNLGLLSSWKSDDDPAPGDFSIHLDPTGYPQTLIKRGNTTVNRFGPWNGVRFSGSPDAKNDRVYKFTLWRNEKEVKFREDFVVMPTGSTVRWIWSPQTREWANYRTIIADNCDTYNWCGAYGVCNIGHSPPFELSIRRRVLEYPEIKLPDARNTTINEQMMSLSDCEAECSRNCDCTAYTRLNISVEGSGCLFYHGDLIDIKSVSTAGHDLYIRMA